MGRLFLYSRPQGPDYELSAAALPRFAHPPDPWLSRSFRDAAEPRAGVRYIVRVAACRKVYGMLDWFGVALRWPVALYINMVAVFRAWKTYLGESEFATKPVVWSKTAHELPDDFANAVR